MKHKSYESNQDKFMIALGAPLGGPMVLWGSHSIQHLIF